MPVTSTQKSDQEQPIAPESDAGAGAILTSHRRTQFFVILACILCFILFWQAGKWIGLPAQPGFGDSVLQQPYWLLALMAIYVLLPVAVAIGTLVAGRFWFFAGLFAGALGLTALSLRGGPMRYVLFHAADAGSTHRIFFQLALEQCLLFVPVGAIWLFFARGYEASLPKIESEKDKTPGNGTLLMSLATQFAFMVFCLVIFTPTDGKKQVLVSTFLAGFTGTAMAEWLVPDRKASAWYWMAPLAVGLLGYILASMNATNFTTGYAIGTFANLAHPLPLDYASSGIAGTLLGFWIGADRPELAMSIISGPMLGLVFRRRWVKTPQPSDGKN
jgi:hypothetical protein